MKTKPTNVSAFRYIAPALLLALSLPLAACTREGSNEAVFSEAETPPTVQADQVSLPAKPVRLTEQQWRELRIGTAEMKPQEVSVEIELPGEVYPSPERYAQVSAPISGRVVQVYAHAGEAVAKGQPLLAIESLEFANLAAEYLQARAEERYQRTQSERLKTLVERKIAPQNRLERTEADLIRAQASVTATYARLRAIGVLDRQIETWSESAGERPLLQIYSPITGTVDRHLVDLGQSVAAYQEMMSIVNTDEVLIRGFVSPEDAPAIRPGDPVVVGLKDVPGRELRAVVTTINPSVDAENRSVTVNIKVRTQARWPMPGQNVRLRIATGEKRPLITLPLSALTYDGNAASVFVRLDDRTFEPRPIQVERVSEDHAVVRAGLKAGEVVAISQVFSLKALARYEKYAEE